MSWNVHIHVLCGRWKITGSGHSLRCYLTSSMTLVKTSVLSGCVICSSQLPQVIVLTSLASTTCYGGDSTITIANHRREPHEHRCVQRRCGWNLLSYPAP